VFGTLASPLFCSVWATASNFSFFLSIPVRSLSRSAHAVAFPCNLSAMICLVSENDSGLMREAAGSTSPRCFFYSVGARAASAEAYRTADPFVSLSQLFPVEST
jgi:hypothetical protein